MPDNGLGVLRPDAAAGKHLLKHPAQSVVGAGLGLVGDVIHEPPGPLDTEAFVVLLVLGGRSLTGRRYGMGRRYKGLHLPSSLEATAWAAIWPLRTALSIVPGQSVSTHSPARKRLESGVTLGNR